MDAVRKLKANLRLEGKACGWCQAVLKLGEDAAVCTTCEKEHHSQCWDTKAGCSTTGCANAPLRRLDSPVAGAGVAAAAAYPQDLPPGLMACPTCRTPIAIGALICPSCRAITSPDGIYRGPKINAPGATAALVYGLVGLVFCGVVLGPVAISKASAAKKAMAADPTLGGEGLATAGKVLGIIDLVLFVLYVMIKASNP